MSNIYLDLNVNTVFNMNPIVTFKSPFSDYYPGCSEKIIGINSKLCPICLSSLFLIKARLNECDTFFCCICLILWNEQKHTRPLCRISYTNNITL